MSRLGSVSEGPARLGSPATLKLELVPPMFGDSSVLPGTISFGLTSVLPEEKSLEAEALELYGVTTLGPGAHAYSQCRGKSIAYAPTFL